MPATLHVVHGSHPCAAVRRALELKGVEHRIAEYPPPLHMPIQKLRTGTRTVPSIRFADGELVSGSSAIMRRLDERVPEPPLYPDERVAEAEAWGESVLQPVARRVLWPAFARNPAAMGGYQHGGKLPPLPAPVVRALAPVVTRVERRANEASDDAVRADLRALPSHLDRVDGWIADGTLTARPAGPGSAPGPAPNAADLQIGSTLRLLLTVADVRPLIAGRPAADLALRLWPAHAGEVPAGTLPAEWLPAAA